MPPNGDNHRKASYPRTQQRDQVEVEPRSGPSEKQRFFFFSLAPAKIYVDFIMYICKYT